MKPSRPALLVLGLVAAIARAVFAQPESPMLFHCSFDRPAPGAERTYPSATFAAGRAEPCPAHRVALDEEGRFGQAARVAGNAFLAFDAAFNMRSERGTIAFWFKPVAHCTPNDDTYLVSAYGLPVMTDQNFSFLRSKYDSRVRVFAPDGEPPLAWPEHFAANTWRHVAIAWDAVIGCELYGDGRLVARGGGPFWPERLLDRIGVGAMVSSYRVLWHGRMDKSFDELYVFDRALTAAEVKDLMETNRPPKQAGGAPDPARWLEWRMTEAGLRGELPGLACGPDANIVAFAFARQARDVKLATYAPIDGRRGTAWPVARGYSTGGAELTVCLDPGADANWARVRGDLWGSIHAAGAPLAVLAQQDRPRQAGRWRWLPLAEPLPGGVVEVRREGGSLDELDFVRVSSQAAPDIAPAALRFLGHAATANPEIARRYEPWDRTALWAWAAPPASQELALPAGRLLHVMMIDPGGDMDVGAAWLDLSFAARPADTAVSLSLLDPVCELREIGSFQGRIQGSHAEGRRLRILVDHRDTRVRAGRFLWWTLCFDKDVTLNLGGPEGSRIAAVTAAKGSDQFLHDQTCAMRDIYVRTSDGEPAQMPGDPRREYRVLDEMLTICEEILRIDPANAFARGAWHRTGANKPMWTPEACARHPDLPETGESIPLEGAPRWAAVGRAALKQLRQHSDWWIDHRQAPNGEFGHGANDDTDLVGDFVDFALIGDKDNKIRDAIGRLNDYVWEHTLLDGVNKRRYDMNHAYEEGVNILRPNAMLRYGDPVLFERLLGTTRFVQDKLTGVNAAGHRHFRACDFSATDIQEPDGWGVDIASAPFFEPGLYVHWYNGNPLPLRTLREWGDAWLAHDGGDGRFGGRPIEFATDLPATQPRRGLACENVMDAYYALYELTGDAKYNRLVFDTVPKGRSPREFKVFDPFTLFSSWRRLLGERGVDTSAIDAPLKEKAASGALLWMITGDREHLVSQIEKDGWLFMRRMAPMVTWAGLSGDRVSIPGQIPLSYMYLGGIAGKTKWSTYWSHAVSWEDADDDVARFVVEQSVRGLKVLIYSFHDTPREIGMRVWKLAPGDYALRAGTDADLDERPDTPQERTIPLQRHDQVRLRVPPRAQLVVELQRIREAPDTRGRPDLAVCARDIAYDPAAATLTLTIHNIGAHDAPETEAALITGGRETQRRPVPALAAPLDLKPRTTTVVFGNVRAPDGLSVIVDPEDRIAEISEANNRAEARRAH